MALMSTAFWSVPHIAFVIVGCVFGEKVTVFLLKRPRAVVFLLGVDVMEQGVLLTHAHGECSVALLPVEAVELRVSFFQPFTGRGFDFLHQVCHGKSAGKTHRQMHMIRHAADAIRLAIHVPYCPGEKGVGLLTHARRQPRIAVLGAPYQMNEDVGE